MRYPVVIGRDHPLSVAINRKHVIFATAVEALQYAQQELGAECKIIGVKLTTSPFGMICPSAERLGHIWVNEIAEGWVTIAPCGDEYCLLTTYWDVDAMGKRACDEAGYVTVDEAPQGLADYDEDADDAFFGEK